MDTRRAFLRQAGLLAAVGAGIPAGTRAAESARPAAGVARGAAPRHIIHLVADGMSSGTLTLADYFSRETRGRGLHWFSLCARPDIAQAFMNVRSLNSMVTDSAASSTAWGSGSRVQNGLLNYLPDGRQLRPLHDVFGEAGWKRGLVTTTEITHATPAGFAARAKREEAESIARQYLQARIDVLLGGGRKYFAAATRADKKDVHAEYRTAGYTVMTEAGQLEAAPLDRPWLGTFSSGHLPYTLDQQAEAKLQKSVPTLSAMTRRALRKLGREDRFLLQVEGGRVDHAAHANDIAAAVHEMLAFDDALEACLEFQQAEPETLLVITTDHGTGNPGLNSSGGTFGKTRPLFTNVLKARASFAAMAESLGDHPAAGQIQQVVASRTGYQIPDRKAALLASFYAKKALTMYEAMNSVSAQMGQVMANYYGVGWTSGEHTADFVPLLALGPGAGRFRGFLENTDVFHHYLALAGIDFRNPEAPLLTEVGPAASDVEACARLA